MKSIAFHEPFIIDHEDEHINKSDSGDCDMSVRDTMMDGK